MTDESNAPTPDLPGEPDAAVEAAPAVEPDAPAPMMEPSESVAEAPVPAADPIPDPPPAPLAPEYTPAAPPPAPPQPEYAPAAAPPPAPPQPEYAPPPAPPMPGYVAPTAPPQPTYAAPVAPAGDKQKVVAGILAILLGAFGIHKFYLGYNKEGIILLAVSLISFGMLAWIPSIIGLVEGIMYLTKTDEEFYAMYVAGRKAWF
ncbi:MAG: TM2 domain-containing protein [Coriobacteriia bacterium]|nr:TM2 domain-containing protein [Coriobacteriia bacterium]